MAAPFSVKQCGKWETERGPQGFVLLAPPPRATRAFEEGKRCVEQLAVLVRWCRPSSEGRSGSVRTWNMATQKKFIFRDGERCRDGKSVLKRRGVCVKWTEAKGMMKRTDRDRAPCPDYSFFNKSCQLSKIKSWNCVHPNLEWRRVVNLKLNH